MTSPLGQPDDAAVVRALLSPSGIEPLLEEFGWTEDDLIARAKQIIRDTGRTIGELRQAL